jgi:CheY-like chemotaxis protein
MPDREHAGPTLAKATDDARERRESGPCESGARLRVAQRSVFLADDDDDLRSTLKEILARAGFDVIEASTGAEALELLSSAADGSAPLPDVVLLDFLMPEFSGLGILRVMRRLLRMPPTIIMTGFPDPSVETFARTFGAACVLRKPIDASVLLMTVLEWMPVAASASLARRA